MVCLWGYSWMRLTFEWINWVKQIALPMRVGFIQFNGQTRTKKLNKRKIFIFSFFLSQFHSFSSGCENDLLLFSDRLSLRLEFTSAILLVLRIFSFRLEFTLSGLLGLQLANCKSRAWIIMWVTSLLFASFPLLSFSFFHSFFLSLSLSHICMCVYIQINKYTHIYMATEPPGKPVHTHIYRYVKIQ